MVNKKIYPNKLVKGDEIRVIAPSRSLGIISEETRTYAKQFFEQLGFKLTFGKHVEEIDEFRSSSLESRLEDIHGAFSDKNVKGIFTVIGGFNSNQLLNYIDWELVINNPKILCGYSDITALNNAFFTKTGLVTYSGPHYSTFGKKLLEEYTIEYMKKCLISDDPYIIEESEYWNDDEWYKNQKKQNLIKNLGHVVIQEGEAEGTLLGGNTCTFNLLQGTEFMPDLSNSILFLEDDSDSLPHTFDRDLQSLIHQPGFIGVQGIVIGRFQKASKITIELLSKIIKSKKELVHLPIIAGVDFGHTDPKITFPIGGDVSINAQRNNTKITITKH